MTTRYSFRKSILIKDFLLTNLWLARFYLCRVKVREERKGNGFSEEQYGAEDSSGDSRRLSKVGAFFIFQGALIQCNRQSLGGVTAVENLAVALDMRVFERSDA